MTLSQLARLFGKGAVYTRDINAIARGTIGKRLKNRAKGYLANWFMRRIWTR